MTPSPSPILTCGACRVRMKAPASLALGQRVVCPGCREPILVDLHNYLRPDGLPMLTAVGPGGPPMTAAPGPLPDLEPDVAELEEVELDEADSEATPPRLPTRRRGDARGRRRQLWIGLALGSAAVLLLLVVMLLSGKSGGKIGDVPALREVDAAMLAYLPADYREVRYAPIAPRGNDGDMPMSQMLSTRERFTANPEFRTHVRAALEFSRVNRSDTESLYRVDPGAKLVEMFPEKWRRHTAVPDVVFASNNEGRGFAVIRVADGLVAGQVTSIAPPKASTNLKSDPAAAHVAQALEGLKSVSGYPVALFFPKDKSPMLHAGYLPMPKETSPVAVGMDGNVPRLFVYFFPSAPEAEAAKDRVFDAMSQWARNRDPKPNAETLDRLDRLMVWTSGSLLYYQPPPPSGPALAPRVGGS